MTMKSLSTVTVVAVVAILGVVAPPEMASGFSAQLKSPWERRSKPALHGISSSRTAVSYKDDKNTNDDGDQQTTANEKQQNATDTVKAKFGDQLLSSLSSMEGNNNDPYTEDDIHMASSGPVGASTSTSTSSTGLMVDNYHPENKDPTNRQLRSYLPQLLQMCRPGNFAGILVFHVLGAHLGISSLVPQHAAAGTTISLWKLLLHPQMLTTLFVLLGVASTSMMVNDYYDTKSGVDNDKNKKKATIPLPVVKKALVYGYASLLIALSFVPGVVGRISGTLSLMLTYWYTKHLKPVTWMKNIVCASIMAFAPLTSGSVAMHLATNAMNTATTATATTVLGPSSELLRLVSLLFFGFLGREMTMDLNDATDDERSGITTVPVRYGKRFAARTALLCSILVGGLAVAVPGKQATAIISGLLGANADALMSRSGAKLVLAAAGSARMIQRAWAVHRTEGADQKVNDGAIEEGKITLLLLLVSFFL